MSNKNKTKVVIKDISEEVNRKEIKKLVSSLHSKDDKPDKPVKKVHPREAKRLWHMSKLKKPSKRKLVDFDKNVRRYFNNDYEEGK